MIVTSNWPDNLDLVIQYTLERKLMPYPEPRFEVDASRQFPNWLAGQQISLAVTTYQAGKLFLIGLQPDGRLSIFERTFSRCMGLWSDGQTLWLSTLFQ